MRYAVELTRTTVETSIVEIEASTQRDAEREAYRRYINDEQHLDWEYSQYNIELSSSRQVKEQPDASH